MITHVRVLQDNKNFYSIVCNYKETVINSDKKLILQLNRSRKRIILSAAFRIITTLQDLLYYYSILSPILLPSLYIHICENIRYSITEYNNRPPPCI